MKTILSIQHKANMLYLNAFFLLALYVIISLTTGTFSLINFIGIIRFATIVLINFLLYKFEYFNKSINYVFVKAISLFSSTYLAFNQKGAVQFFFIMLSLLIIIEMFIALPIQKRAYKIYISVLAIVVVAIAVLTNVHNSWSSWDIFFGICIITLFLYSYYLMFRDYKEELLGKLRMQTKLFKEAAKTNDELRLSQNKFKLIHEEIATQKYYLEIANKKLNKMTAEIYTQNELLRYISSVLDIKELLDVVTDAIMGTIGVDTCSLVLFDERKEEYLYSVKSNHSGDHMTNMIKDVEDGLLQKYFESGKVNLNNRVVLKNYPFISSRPVGSIAIIPLLRDDLTYGLLVAEHTNIDMFTESNVQFFSGIATQITIAINNANIYALMAEMAIKDGMTGIFNRKYLLDNIDKLIGNAKEKNTPLSIALFDIDRFKSVNDKYGHLFGDEAIKMAAFMTQKQAKLHDGLAIRYGGEEFVLVLPNCDLNKANEIVTVLHEIIKSEVLLYKGEEVYINVSIGISSYPEVASHGEELLLRADNAMYYGKEHGRGVITLDGRDLEKVV